MLHSWGGPFGIGGAHMMRMGDRFEEQYHCYSMAFADKAHLEVNMSNDRKCSLLSLCMCVFVCLFVINKTL